MAELNYSTASLDEIVFETRNKNYGAFLLRRIYNKHITIATIIAVSLFVLFLSIPLVARMFAGEVEKPVVKTITVNDLMEPPPLDQKAPPPPPPDLPPPPPPVVSTIKFTPPVIKKDEEVREQEEIPDQKDLEKANISTVTVKGNTDAIDLSGLEGDGTSDVVAEVVEEKPFAYVEQMPQFADGDLQAYMAKNTKFPPQALRAGISGTVYLSFTVTKTGEITDIKVLKGLGYGTDEEAVRVVKSMPRWIPGKQGGRAVPVTYNLPFRFNIK
jgi:periplasmic protein TonB